MLVVPIQARPRTHAPTLQQHQVGQCTPHHQKLWSETPKPDPLPTSLEAMQKLAKEGVLNIKDDGNEHNLPLEAMGVDVVAATSAATVRTPFTYGNLASGNVVGTTSIEASLAPWTCSSWPLGTTVGGCTRDRNHGGTDRHEPAGHRMGQAGELVRAGQGGPPCHGQHRAGLGTWPTPEASSTAMI